MDQELLAYLSRFDGENRLDADHTAFLARQLEQVRSKVFEVQYPSTKALTFFPMATDVDPLTETFVHEIWDSVGSADIVNLSSDDWPKSEVYVKQGIGSLVTIGASYSFDFLELRRSAKYGRDLEGRKARAARDHVELALDILTRTGTLGGRNLGLVGAINASAINATPGTMSDWLDPDTTADAILNDLNLISYTPGLRTKELYEADTMLMAPELLALIKTRRVPDLKETILNVFLANSSTVRSVAQWGALSTAGSGGKHRVMVYKRDPAVLEAVVPTRFEILPPQVSGHRTTYWAFARAGGMKIYRPDACQYADIAVAS